jgi:hypothetical protein
MTLLADFRTISGIASTVTDQFIIDYYLRPAIDRASEICLNYKLTEITLTNGTQSYNLTTSVANPVVSASGIESVVIDGDVYTYLQYGRDFIIQGLTTLYIVDSTKVFGGTMQLKYNAYYTKPTTAPTETDLPTNLWPAVIQYANAVFQLQNLTNASEANGGIERKKEDNLETTYGTIDARKTILEGVKKDAENSMQRINGKPRFDFIQVI